MKEPIQAFPYKPPNDEIKKKYSYIFSNDFKMPIHHIKIIFDKSITNFVDNNFYLLRDKKFFFLAYLLRKENNQTNPQKVIVKPYETRFRPFRIDEEKLTIYSKILFLSCLMSE